MYELLTRIGSAEIASWRAEYKLRAEDERKAIEDARAERGVG